jgi:hypothetical protein
MSSNLIIAILNVVALLIHLAEKLFPGAKKGALKKTWVTGLAQPLFIQALRHSSVRVKFISPLNTMLYAYIDGVVSLFNKAGKHSFFFLIPMLISTLDPLATDLNLEKKDAALYQERVIFFVSQYLLEANPALKIEIDQLCTALQTFMNGLKEMVETIANKTITEEDSPDP